MAFFPETEDIFLESAFTVSQVNAYIKDRFSEDENLRALTIKGEVSNFVNHAKTGHFYFTLKDAGSSIRSVMFRGNAERVKFNVENGMNVVIRGSIQVFERDGAYQLYCQTLEPDGVGALFVAFEQLKARLAEQGLFDEAHKKSIPLLPRRIGVVTAKTGAALQDVLNILGRRYPIGEVVVIPALVQGENAPASIVNGIHAAEAHGDIDVLIVGRGGGSIEDLWSFNSEAVARAIYDCEIPIISAVGHEIDFTIADFVADLRAPTPSAAAELCAMGISDIRVKIDTLLYRLNGLTAQTLKSDYERLKSIYSRLVANSPMQKLETASIELASKNARLEAAMTFLFHKKGQQVTDAVSTLEALSPLKVLARGYAITFAEGKPVSAVSAVSVGQSLVTRLCDGEVTSTVTDVKKIRTAKKTTKKTVTI